MTISESVQAGISDGAVVGISVNTGDAGAFGSNNFTFKDGNNFIFKDTNNFIFKG